MAFDKTIKSLDELPALARAIIDFAANDRVFLFYAPMGAGKTTFIKEICKALGSTDNFSSPTYSIINEYRYRGGKIFHFDLYRIKNSEELLDLGMEEYIHSGNYCFFEWPEMVVEFLDSYVKIEMEVNENIHYLRASKIQV